MLETAFKIWTEWKRTTRIDYLSARVSIGRLGFRSTATEWIAEALLGQERAP